MPECIILDSVIFISQLVTILIIVLYGLCIYIYKLLWIKNTRGISQLNVEFEVGFSFKYAGLKSASGMLQTIL